MQTVLVKIVQLQIGMVNPKIGLSFFPPEEVEIASESTDIPLDYCVTPERIYEF